MACRGGMNLGDECRNWDQVGLDFLSKAVGGGSGTIMIDLLSDHKEISPSETYTIMVTVGSDTKNGVRSIGVDSIKIPISVEAERYV